MVQLHVEDPGELTPGLTTPLENKLKQVVHVAEPGREYVLAGHTVHTLGDCPFEPENAVPAGHCTQLLEPADENVPPGHDLHEVLAEPSEYVPALH
jgi:hypothetical protein